MAVEAFLAFCPSASRRPPMIEIRQDPKMFRQFDIQGIVIYKIFVYLKTFWIILQMPLKRKIATIILNPIYF